jgi:hypothetical protein
MAITKMRAIMKENLKLDDNIGAKRNFKPYLMLVYIFIGHYIK